jgi:hypothetical protein
MALNIPVNLMSTLAQPALISSGTSAAPQAEGVGAVAPMKSTSHSRDSASGAGTGQDSNSQQMLMAHMRMTLSVPDRAEPNSIVTALTASPQPTPVRTERSQTTSNTEGARPRELDRYAPPDPLPTAPILQAAASYAARREALE